MKASTAYRTQIIHQALMAEAIGSAARLCVAAQEEEQALARIRNSAYMPIPMRERFVEQMALMLAKVQPLVARLDEIHRMLAEPNPHERTGP